MFNSLTHPLSLLLGVLFLFLSGSGWAENNPTFRVSPDYQYLVDETGDLSLRDILDTPQTWSVSRFPGSVQQGYVGDTLWLRFSITVNSIKPLRMYMELATPFLDYVDFYLVQPTPQGKNLLAHGIGGDHQAFIAQDLEHRFPIFPINVSQAGDYEVYVRLSSDSAMIFPVNFRTPEGFFQSEFRAQAFYGLFFGMMSVLAFYNAYVWYFLRDRTNLFNMAFIVSAMLYQASISGFGSLYLWGSQVFLNDKSYGLGILSTIFFAGHFAVLFIDLKNRIPWLARLTRFFVTMFGLGVIPVVLFPERLVLPFIYPLEMLVCIYAIFVLTHQCFTDNYWARYLMAGWSVLITGTCFYVAAQLEWIQFSVAIEYIHAAGLSLGNLMVTSALAARMQRERSEKNRALKQALDLAQEVTELTREKEQIAASARDELERRVDQKTRDLSAMLDQLKQSNEKLAQDTLTDALTGVGNRRYLDTCFPELIRQCQQTRSSLGILVIDADHFKKINDQFGHLVGDECLKKIAVILQRFSRRNLDVLVRYGGEEFILLLPATDEAAGQKVAESIRSHIQFASFWHSKRRIPVTVSIGVHSVIPDGRETAEKLLVKADEALYRAKKNGRNCVEVYQPEQEAANP
ncbi:MAG: diguanylate cyclase [Pseudomonadota bacterium]|nr:diguanylate cyclase [Pseudomonadota bacterium]